MLAGASSASPLRRRSRRAGFTLVELLVVIVIIAVLASLLLPVIASMQRKGQQSASANNLRQWGIGFRAAVSEHDGEMPMSGATRTGFKVDDETAWYNRIPRAMKERPMVEFNPNVQPKLTQKSIWINPAVPQKMAVTGGGFTFCYAYNQKLVAAADTPNADETPLKAARLEFPAKTILMGETALESPGLRPDTVRAFFGSGDPLTDVDNFANFLFCDGHVEAFQRKAFSDQSMVLSEQAMTQKITQLTYLPFIEQ